MKTLLGVVKPNDENLIYATITSTNGAMYCRKCNAIFTFEEVDIDRNKSLPHIDCLNCGRSIQLPAKYLQKKPE